MLRPSTAILSLGTTLALGLAAAPAEAQLMEVEEPSVSRSPPLSVTSGGLLRHRIPGAPSGAGQLQLEDSFAWAAIIASWQIWAAPWS